MSCFFYLYNLTFLISDCILFFLYAFCFSCYLVFICSVFPVALSLFLLCLSLFCFSCYFFYVTLSFLLFCLYVILSLSFLSFFFLPLCHSVYSLSFCLFSCFCRTSSPLFSSSFWLHFYSFTCLFFDIFA